MDGVYSRVTYLKPCSVSAATVQVQAKTSQSADAPNIGELGSLTQPLAVTGECQRRSSESASQRIPTANTHILRAGMPFKMEGCESPSAFSGLTPADWRPELPAIVFPAYCRCQMASICRAGAIVGGIVGGVAALAALTALAAFFVLRQRRQNRGGVPLSSKDMSGDEKVGAL